MSRSTAWCEGEFVGGLPVSMQVHTDGRGQWSKDQRCVDIYKIEVLCWDYEVDYRSKCNCTLRAYFTARSWDINKHGLIYTDPGWLQAFREELIELGVSPSAAREVDYTEQSLQGDNYVDLSAPPILARTLFPEEIGLPVAVNPKQQRQLKNRLLQ